MRHFNTHGPVNEIEHYVVPRTQLLTDLVAQIERGKYFTIYAPRQMGKTTLLRRFADVLHDQQDYLPITLDFELGYSGLSVARFLEAFRTDFGRQVLKTLEASSEPQVAAVKNLLASDPPVDFFALREFLQALHDLIPSRRLVLIVDEFDATPQEVISPLLETWRGIYLSSAPPRSLHSVVLIGIQNIATLNLGRSSPFNIAYQLQLPGFTVDQVRDLLGQYTTESGQAFAEGMVEEIYHQTSGQPFLVNRLAALLTEEIATDRSQPITASDLQSALDQLMRERNYNYETLVRHASSYREQVLRILFGARLKFTLNTPWVHALSMYGIVQENKQGFCQIANPIYERILTDHFQPLESDLQAAILVNSYDLRRHVVSNELQMKALLSRFREFVERRGREAFTVTPMPREATGQYLLMAYLDLVVRQLGGDLFTEVDSGEGRMDLIVVHQGRRYVVETKIWHGKVEFDKGVAQLAGYLETEGQKSGYLVVFHARPRVYGKLTHKELEFTLSHDSRTIHVYLVRLGHILSDKSKKLSK